LIFRKFFQKKAIPDLESPKYTLLTNEQLKKLEDEAKKRGEQLLQMPPVQNSWVNDDTATNTLSSDTHISHFDASECRYVFTDITYGLARRNRAVVVREADGILRHADHKERDRILQVYFPRAGKMYLLPKIFEEHMLEKALCNYRYEYILDRACNQFEPDDPDYIQVTNRTYEHVLSQLRFNDLRSTRHFGPMAFYLTCCRKIDHLLVDMIQRDLLTDAEKLVRLFYIIHPECLSATSATMRNETKSQELILMFARNDATHGGIIELAVQSYSELHAKQTTSFVA